MTLTIVRRSLPKVLLTAGAVVGASGVQAGAWQGVGEFEDATIRVERNATDGDTEIVMTAKPLTDNGLVRLSILSPRWRKVVEVEAASKTRGLREFLDAGARSVGDSRAVSRRHLPLFRNGYERPALRRFRGAVA